MWKYALTFLFQTGFIYLFQYFTPAISFNELWDIFVFVFLLDIMGVIFIWFFIALIALGVKIYPRLRFFEFPFHRVIRVFITNLVITLPIISVISSLSSNVEFSSIGVLLAFGFVISLMQLTIDEILDFFGFIDSDIDDLEQILNGASDN